MWSVKKQLVSEGRYERIKIGKYRGWMKKGYSRRTIVYFGGNNEMCSKAFTSKSRNGFLNRIGDTNFIMLDYPGFGDNPGKPSKKKIFKMADTLMKHVMKTESLNGSVYVMGYSLGTGVATYEAARNKVDGLILIAPYDNMANAMNEYVNIFHGPMKLLVKNKFKSDKYARHVSCKALVFASKGDKTIPYRRAVRLQKFFKNKEFHLLESEGHSKILKQAWAQDRIVRFINGW